MGHKAALQFSGGKDSLALLHVMREHLDKITVYWLNSGDPYPETLAAVEYCKSIAPNFVEVTSDVQAQIQAFGVPSDLVPCSATQAGIAAAGGSALIQSRYDCCARTIMLPLHARMHEDGVTLLIRGQKNADHYKGQLRSGDKLDGFEFYYPLEDWSDEQVFQYLKDNNVPIPAYYEVLSSGPDCMCCTGWWEEGRSRWLRHYPRQFETYQQRLSMIQVAVMPHISAFNQEIEP